MRRVVLLLATISLAVLLVSGLALAQPAPDEVPDAACPTNGQTPNQVAFLRNSAIVAQTFTAQHTGLLTSAQVPIENTENETTSIVMEINTVDSSGTPTEVVLASTIIPASEVPPHPQSGVVTGHFSPGAPVEAGQEYALALHTTTEPQANGLGWLGFRSDGTLCPGVAYRNSGFGVFLPFAINLDLFFSTFVTPDTTPPKVISTVPKANANEVAPTANVRATFSEEMDSNTINDTTFQLFEKGTTNQIDATVSYNANTDTAKLDPTNNLSKGVAYKAVVTTWAKDVAGNRLDQDSSTSGLQQMRWFFRVDD